MRIITVMVVGVMLLTLVAWRAFYRTGGLERYFWSAALTFFRASCANGFAAPMSCS